VARSYWGGDHSLFLGQVEYARYGEGRPLLFHAGQYERLPLAAVSVFSGLSPELQQAVLARGEVKTFTAGQPVLGEGESGDVLFLLLEGAVRVERTGRTIATLQEGDFFGEVSVLAGGPRTADVIAESPVRTLTVSRQTLRETLAADPDVAWAMLETVASRLREP
jgi:CRP-like cAMP-binding protein